MNRDPILIRVDATPHSGGERFQRCLTLAGALQRRRRPTYFLSQLEPASPALTIKRAGHHWLDADEAAGTQEDLGETLQEIRRLGPAAVLIDAPDVSADYLAEISSTGVLLISMDHLANLRFPSALVINPLLEPGRDDYDFIPGTQLLLGPRYTLVRPEIRRVRQVRTQEPPPPYRVLVALTDANRHLDLLDLTQQLLAISRLQRVDVLVPEHSPQFRPLQQLAERYPERLELAADTTDLPSRLARCHFAITSGAGFSLELACVGVPQLLLMGDESFAPSARRLEDEGAAICLGIAERLTHATLRQAVHDLLGDASERQALARCGRKLIDGRGSDRLVTAIEVMLHPSHAMGMRDAA